MENSKKQFLKTLFLMFLALGANLTYAQDLVEFLAGLERIQRENPQEKVYLHTDRSNYTAGETIWFKSYNTIGVENKLSLLSQITYIELIDPLTNVVAEKVVAHSMGVANGSITLADTLMEGVYRLRAYTNWMRNDDTDYFFDKRIRISNGRIDNLVLNASKADEGNGSHYVVQFSTIDGAPIVNQKLKYQRMLNGKTASRPETGKTDGKGQVMIKETSANKGGDFLFTFSNPNGQTVSKLLHTAAFESEHSLQILPEGGYILSGNSNNLAFKALQSNGMGIKAFIEILNQEGEVIDSTETNVLGMATLPFSPKPDEQYSVRAVFEDQTTKIGDMPEIHRSGLSLQVLNLHQDRIQAQVNIAQDLLSDKELVLILHHLGQVFFTDKKKMDVPQCVFHIPKNNLPTGVLTVTILDENLKPVFERPVFHQGNDRLPIQLSVDNSSFGLRDRVEVSVQVGNAIDSMRTGSFSAAVVHLDKLTDTVDEQSNMLSALLMEADLRGHIENPGYYFRDNNNLRLADIDVLLLTQGWRKLPWHELDSTDKPKPFKAEKGLSIEGHVRKLGRKAPSSHTPIRLYPELYSTQYIDTLSAGDGYFKFDNLMFADRVKFVLSAKDARDKRNVDIVVAEKTRPNIAVVKRDVNALNMLYKKELVNSKSFFRELEGKGLMDSSIRIGEVLVSRRFRKVPIYSQNLYGPGRADQVLTQADFQDCAGNWDFCLNRKLFGIRVEGGVPYNAGGRGPRMQVVVDGVYFENVDFNTILMQDVASIEVHRSELYLAAYGSYGRGGVLVVTLKKNRGSNDPQKGRLTIQPQGIATAAEFYKPVYEVDSEHTFRRDLRTTIHWEPFVLSSKEGKASFDFYTSDEPGRYRVILEGIDLQGRIGRKMLDFEVVER